MSPNSNPLDGLRIAAPCSASWEGMEGDEQVRFCRHCQLNVYNLSGMSQRDAAALVREREGRRCVRFYQRRDGTVLTDNCPVGLRVVRRWLLAQMGGIAAFFGLIGLAGPLQSSRRLQALCHIDWDQVEPLSTVSNWRVRLAMRLDAICPWLDPFVTTPFPTIGQIPLISALPKSITAPRRLPVRRRRARPGRQHARRVRRR